MKLGGAAEFIGATNSGSGWPEQQVLPIIFGLFAVPAKPVNGKWSLPLGHPLSQNAFQVRPAAAILSMRVGALIQQLYPFDIPWSDPEIRAV
jgi:hypothetical protein